METQAKKLKCAIYARQSVGGEKESDSVEAQIEQGQETAVAAGYEVVGIFQDFNRASWTYPDTLEARLYASNDKALLKELKESSKKEKDYYRIGLGNLFNKLSDIDVIIIKNQDRLYRSLANSNLENFIRVKIIENGITIHSITEDKKNYTNSMDLFISSLTNLIKAKDLIEKKNDSKAAKQKRKDKGFATISRIHGYIIKDSKATPTKVLPFIKIAIDMFIKGASKIKVRNYLQDNGLPNMSLYGLNIIFNNPMYAGYYWKNGGAQQMINDNIINNELVPALQFKGVSILSLDEWKQLQIICKQYKKICITKKYDYIHTGLIYCGYCGHLMKTHNNNGEKILKCSQWHFKRQGTKDCKGISIKLQNDKQNHQQLEGLLKSVAIFAYASRQEIEKKNEETKLKIDAIQYDINKIIAQKTIIENEVVENILDTDKVQTLKNILNKLSDKLKILKSDIAILNKNIKPIVLKDYSKLEEEINDLSGKEINDLLKTICTKIKVYNDRIEIELNEKELTQELKNENIITVKRISYSKTAVYSKTFVDEL